MRTKMWSFFPSCSPPRRGRNGTSFGVLGFRDTPWCSAVLSWLKLTTLTPKFSKAPLISRPAAFLGLRLFFATSLRPQRRNEDYLSGPRGHPKINTGASAAKPGLSLKSLGKCTFALGISPFWEPGAQNPKKKHEMEDLSSKSSDTAYPSKPPPSLQ